MRHDVQAYVIAYEAAGNSAYRSNYEGLNYRPAYDLRPLIDLVINTTNPVDITAELEQTEDHDSELRHQMHAFREVINESQRERTGGMHYAYYTTIMQVLHLLAEKWTELSHNDRNYDKCRLVFSQIFGYLQLVGLPARERFAFARAFDNKKLSAECRYAPGRILLDFDFSAVTPVSPITPSPNSPEVDSACPGGVVAATAGRKANLVRTGLGFSFGIAGLQVALPSILLEDSGVATAVRFKSHVEQKLNALGTYAHTAADRDTSVERFTSVR